MYCKNCGNPMDPNASVCVKCGCAKGTGMSYCPNCGNATAPGAAVCLSCGCSLTTSGPTGEATKSKLVAGLLAIFLGSLGIHNFYLGYTTKAVVQLLLTLVGTWITCGVSAIGAGIWALVEGIMLLTGKIDRDGKGCPLKD